MKDKYKKFTIQDIEAAMKILRNQQPPIQPHVAYFTPFQIKVMTKEGENIDFVNMKINGYLFQMVDNSIT